MSYPPPPGLKSAQLPQTSTTQPHPSLPARPPIPASSSYKPPSSAGPPTANGAPGTTSYNHGRPSNAASASSAFTAFKPRTVAGPSSDWNSSSASISAGPQPPSNYPGSYAHYGGESYKQQQYPFQQYQQQQYYQQQGPEAYASATPPQIQNPFPLPGQQAQSGYSRGNARDKFDNSNYDPEMEAQIAQWQSAYATKDESVAQKGGAASGPSAAGGANAVALGSRGHASAQLTTQEVASAAKTDPGVASVVAGADGQQKTVLRSGGGQTWQDPSLLEWDPAHFRLFVGNLAGEVTDDSLLKAFSKYDSVQKARVVRDKRTTKSKGYGFVSFSDGDQYFQAAKEMQGKYIGSHPVLLRRSTTEIRPTNPADKNKKGKGGKAHGGGAPSTESRVTKKQSKTKGGLKILG